MTRPLRTAVIGLGFGQFQAQTLINLPEYALVAVADRNPARDLSAYERRYGVRGYHDALELLEREDLDAVIISTSPKGRAPLLQVASARQLAIFVEKPWAANLVQAREYAAICAEGMVMLGFSFRFLPVVQRLYALLKGELGMPWVASAEYLSNYLPPPESWLWDADDGGGYFNENSCHLLDVLCYLMGDVASVYAKGTRFTGRPSEESAAVTLEFASGAVASVLLGGCGAAAQQHYPRLNLITANGQAQLLGRDHIWTALHWARREQGELQVIETQPERLSETRYVSALRHFAACVDGAKAPESGVADGVRAVALAEAIYRSLVTGSAVNLEAL
jgi:predicted dehydrogenase